MASNIIRVTEFGSLEDKVRQGATFELREAIPGETRLSDELSVRYENLEKRVRKGNKFWGMVGGATLLSGLAGGLYVGLTTNPAFAGIAVGSPTFLILTMEFLSAEHHLARWSTKQQLKKAIEKLEMLREQGFVPAYDLERYNLIPSLVQETQVVYGGFDAYFAVKPKQNVTLPVVSLAVITEYIGRPVIVTGKVSAAPKSEDMNLKAEAHLNLTGAVAGIFPMGGFISGTVSGRIYSLNTQFRIEESGVSRPVSMDYLTMDQGEVVPPHVLKTVNPEFGLEASLNDRNRLVYFLDEASRKGSEIMIIGRPDRFGVIHAEAIALKNGRSEVHYLGVYQNKALPPPQRSN